MAFYQGSPIEQAPTTIGTADIVTTDLVLRDPQRCTEFTEWLDWLKRAEYSDDILYFSMYHNQKTVGSIFLHDINFQHKEALIGYHIFDSIQRGCGIGTQLLTTLIDFVRRQTILQKLIIITKKTNIAAQRIAEKCGFIFNGNAYEDDQCVVYTLIIDER